MIFAAATLAAALAGASPVPADVIDIVHAPSQAASGYRLSIGQRGNVRVSDERGKFVRDAQVPQPLSRMLFSAVSAAPSLDSLTPGACSGALASQAPTYIRWAGMQSPDVHCGGGNGFLGPIWGVVQQIIGSVGLGALGGMTGGGAQGNGAAGGLGGLGNLGGLGSLFGLGGLLGGGLFGGSGK